MSIFSSIRNAIFGHAQAAEAPQAATTAPPPAASGGPVVSPPSPSPTSPGPSTPSTPAPASAPASNPISPAAPGSVDVGAVLDKAVADSGQQLDWKHSIVDMMKALKLDSSLTARKDLARELGYKSDTSDSAAMNIWLHKAVMAKLAENGGKVPDDLKD